MEKEISKRKYTMKDSQYKHRLMHLVDFMLNSSKIDIFDSSRILETKDRKILGIRIPFLKPLYIGSMLPEAYILARNRRYLVTYEELESLRYYIKINKVKEEFNTTIMNFYGLKEHEFNSIFYSLDPTTSLLQATENLRDFITKKYSN